MGFLELLVEEKTQAGRFLNSYDETGSWTLKKKAKLLSRIKEGETLLTSKQTAPELINMYELHSIASIKDSCIFYLKDPIGY